jgi:AcrR family transcriptional regulator
MTRAARRASLLDVAAAIVDASGPGALTFDALAQAAGVAKTLPYAYFESSDEILVTLFERVIGELDAQVAEVVREGGDFAGVVRRSLAVWFDAVGNHGRLVGALLDGRGVPGLAASIRRRDRASHKLWHDLVIDEFGLAEPDAHLLAAMLTTTATATVDLWVRRRASRAELADRFVVMARGAAAALARG